MANIYVKYIYISVKITLPNLRNGRWYRINIDDTNISFLIDTHAKQFSKIRITFYHYIINFMTYIVEKILETPDADAHIDAIRPDH